MDMPPHARVGQIGRGHRFAADPRRSPDVSRRKRAPAARCVPSKIVESHGSVSLALRVQVFGHLFVQPEYLALFAEGHTDQGPVVAVGLSSGQRSSLRVFGGVGGGPIQGFQGDDGLFFLFGGLSQAIGRSGLFVQGEVRCGLLGESAYSQVGVSLGWSR